MKSVFRLLLLISCFSVGCIFGWGLSYVLPVTIEGYRKDPTLVRELILEKAKEKAEKEKSDRANQKETADSSEDKKEEESLPLEKQPMIKMLCHDAVFYNELPHDRAQFAFTIRGARTVEPALNLYSVNDEEAFVPIALSWRVGPICLDRWNEEQIKQHMQTVVAADQTTILSFPDFFAKYRKLCLFLIPLCGLLFMIIGKILTDFYLPGLKKYTERVNADLTAQTTSVQSGVFFWQAVMALYATFAFSLQTMIPVWAIPFLYLWIFFLFKKGSDFLMKREIQGNCEPREKGKYFRRYFLFFAPLFFGLWLFVCRGMLHNDPIGPYIKYMQTGLFSDWHPVVHTLFNLTFLKICNDFTFVVFAQLMLFSGAMAYLCAALRNHGFSKKTVGIIAALILINPYMLTLLFYPWKDAVFTITGTYVVGMLIHIFCTNGDWLQKKSHFIWFTLLASYLALVRHNGIFFTVPLILVLLFAIPRKKTAWCVFFSVIALCLIIKIPIYKCVLKVKKRAPVEYRIESTGLLMTAFGGYMQNAPEALSDQMRHELETIQPKEVWDKDFEYGDFNGFKRKYMDELVKFWDTRTQWDLILPLLDSIYKKPRTFFGSFSLLTSAVYRIPPKTVVGMQTTDMEQDQLDNYLHITGKEVEIQQLLKHTELYYQCLDFFAKLWNNWGIVRIYCCCGFALMILAFTSFFAVRRHGWKAIMLVFPCFTYGVGTSFLLTGAETRFFFLISVATPVFVTLMLSPKASDRIEDIKEKHAVQKDA